MAVLGHRDSKPHSSRMSSAGYGSLDNAASMLICRLGTTGSWGGRPRATSQ